MALRINDLTNSNTFVGADVFEFSLSGAAGSRKVTGANLRTQILGSGTGFTDSDPLKAGANTTIQAGGSSSYKKLPILMYASGGQSTNATSLTTISSFTLPAALLSTNNDMVRIKVQFFFDRGGAHSYDIAVRFGSTVLWTETGMSPGADNSNFIEAVVRRTGAATQIASGISIKHTVADVTNTSEAFLSTDPAETLSGTVAVDFRGLVSNATSAVFVHWATIEYFPASA